MSRLRVFGCKAYVHVPEQQRKKLHSRAEVGMLAWHLLHTKACWVYVKGWECVDSRNVRFNKSCAHAIPEPRAGGKHNSFTVPELGTAAPLPLPAVVAGRPL